MTDTLIWITGASSGLGWSLAAAQPYGDAQVVDVSRRGGAPGTEHLPADLSDPASWARVEADLRERLVGFTGRRAVFVHNAATIEPIGFAAEVDARAYERAVLLNSAAPQVLGRAFLGAVAQSTARAVLVLITSGAGRGAYEGWSSYCAGKAATDMWTRVAGAEQRRRGGATVLAIAPGVVATPMQERIRAHDERDLPRVERFRSMAASGQLRDADEVARTIWGLVEDPPDSGEVIYLSELGSTS